MMASEGRAGKASLCNGYVARVNGEGGGGARGQDRGEMISWLQVRVARY